MKHDRTHSRKIRQSRFDLLVTQLSRVIRLAFEAGETASLFGLEGPLRAGIRADLCRHGWRWQDADDAARELLASAFRAVRANRPGWDEGQPEWAIHAGTLIERTLCIRCKKLLPEGHFKFCGDLCTAAHFQATARLKAATDDKAYDLVAQASPRGRSYVN